METRLEMLQYLVKTAKEKQEFSYSATMRSLNKNHPEKVKEFMKSFKSAFDAALIDGLNEDVESMCLMQASKEVGIK